MIQCKHQLLIAIVALPPSQSYFRESGLNYLFPRVEMYIQEPDQELHGIANPIMDGV